MKKYLPVLTILALIKFCIQWVGNQNYGFHRDELLHLSVSEHMDWGFMEFPPFIGFLGKLSYWLFDYSLWSVRLFPTLAGVGILILCGLMAKELGGKFRAVFLAAIGVLAFVPFYRNHTLFQPVAFDQLFWTLGFYFIIRFVNTHHHKYLLLTGATLGIGLLNKYTMLVWAFGIFIGLLFYEKGKWFKNKWLYGSGLLGLLIFLPNLLWQLQHDFPLLQHLQSLNEKQLNENGVFVFLLEQLEITPPFILFTCGVLGLFLSKKLQAYRALGIACLVIFATMWFTKAKTYYVFALYPVLFATGAVAVEAFFKKRPNGVYVIAGTILLPMVFFIPEATPVLPIERFIDYKGLEKVEDRVELTSDYADMFGWEEQVQLVDSVYRSLPPKDQRNAVIWAENYGEAGALKILGKKYGLPNPISRHGSFWTWGPGNTEASVWISLGNERGSVENIFEETRLLKIITHPYAIEEENGIPLYLCRKPKRPIADWWADYEDHIFD